MWMKVCVAAGLVFSASAKRVRREIRDLSDEAWTQTVTAYNIMKTTTDYEGGRSVYGQAFVPYDYLVPKHAVASLDPRGDQGHYGPAYVNFHRALILEVENCFLAIVEVEFGDAALVDGLPYWDPSLDSELQGIYTAEDTERYIWSEKYFGSYNGNPDELHQVTDGAFKDWVVPAFATTYIDESIDFGESFYPGNADTGLMRGTANSGPQEFVVRYETYPPFMPDNEAGMIWTNEDFLMCTDPEYIKEFMHWQACNNNAMHLTKPLGQVAQGLFNTNCMVTEESAPNFSCATESGTGDGAPHWLHSQPHYKVGGAYKKGEPLGLGASPCVEDAEGDLTGACPGDMADVATSPNEPAFFFLHNNLERMFVTWAENMNWKCGGLSFDAINYPADYDDWLAYAQANPELYPEENFVLTAIWLQPGTGKTGTTLNDVISDQYGFLKDHLFPEIAESETKSCGVAWSNGEELTHSDILLHVYDGSIPYTYAPPSAYPCDSTSWHKNGDEDKTCPWVALYPEKRCFVKGFDKTLASDACHTA